MVFIQYPFQVKLKPAESFPSAFSVHMALGG